MATYRRRKLDQLQTLPPLDPLRGRMLMRRSRASAIHATGDRVLSHGRRILATCGLHGAKSWHMGDVFNGTSTQTKPLKDTERVVLRTPPIRLTPGHFPRVSLICLPSGQTEALTSGEYNDDGVAGSVKISIAYDNGTDTPTISRTIPLPGSKLAGGSQPTGEGAAWANIHKRDTPPIWPANFALPADLAAWTSVPVIAEITVSYIGSPRVIDLVVYEAPYMLGVDLSDGGGWIAPMHGDGQGGPLGPLPGKTPKTRKSASDPGHGVEVLVDSARRIAQEIGPVFLYHTAWDEGSQSVASTETDYRTIISTNPTDLVTGVVSTAEPPGWSVASGANAQRIQDSGLRILKNGTAIAPMRLYIYGAMAAADGTSATVRWSTNAHEWVDIPIPEDATTWQWYSAPAHMRCGLGAQDPTTLAVRAFVSAAGGGGFRWRYIMAVYDGSI